MEIESLLPLFTTKPYAHQIEAIKLMLEKPRLALLLEQGLGKTYIAIMTLVCFKHLGIPCKTLVVCPNIVFESWLREIAKYSDLKVAVYKGDPLKRKEQRVEIGKGDWDILLTTYHMAIDKKTPKRSNGNNLPNYVLNDLWGRLSKQQRVDYCKNWVANDIIGVNCMAALCEYDKNAAQHLCVIPMASLPYALTKKVIAEYSNVEFFKSVSFDNIIIDEASRVINYKSERSVILKKLADNAKRVYLLSGTLCVGRPTDIYMPFNIMDDKIFNCNWFAFKNTYCIMSRYNKHVVVGYKNVDKLKQKIQSHMLSRKREECLDLPNRVFTTRYYELSDKQIKIYNAFIAKGAVSIDGVKIYAGDSVVKISKCMQVLSGFLYAGESDSACNLCPRIVECVDKGIRPSSPQCSNKMKNRSGDAIRAIDLGANPKLELLEEDLEDCGDEKVIIWA